MGKVTLEKIMLTDPCAYWRKPGRVEEVLAGLDCTSWLSATADFLCGKSRGVSYRSLWSTLVIYAASAYDSRVGRGLLKDMLRSVMRARALVRQELLMPTDEDYATWLKVLAWRGDWQSLERELTAVEPRTLAEWAIRCWAYALKSQDTGEVADWVIVEGHRLAGDCLSIGSNPMFSSVALELAHKIDELDGE